MSSVDVDECVLGDGTLGLWHQWSPQKSWRRPGSQRPRPATRTPTSPCSRRPSPGNDGPLVPLGADPPDRLLRRDATRPAAGAPYEADEASGLETEGITLLAGALDPSPPWPWAVGGVEGTRVLVRRRPSRMLGRHRGRRIIAEAVLRAEGTDRVSLQGIAVHAVNGWEHLGIAVHAVYGWCCARRVRTRVLRMYLPRRARRVRRTRRGSRPATVRCRVRADAPAGPAGTCARPSAQRRVIRATPPPPRPHTPSTPCMRTSALAVVCRGRVEADEPAKEPTVPGCAYRCRRRRHQVLGRLSEVNGDVTQEATQGVA
ncbi:hypothetical protein RJ55_02880 [Drechmeria coniospora]|nr:hypothetical protein RJ55_02880 [Drechmeria coniospora]